MEARPENELTVTLLDAILIAIMLVSGLLAMVRGSRARSCRF